MPSAVRPPRARTPCCSERSSRDAWQGTDAPHAPESELCARTEGVYEMDVVVNAATSITCVALPAWDPKKPMKGTKAARVRLAFFCARVSSMARVIFCLPRGRSR